MSAKRGGPSLLMVGLLLAVALVAWELLQPPRRPAQTTVPASSPRPSLSPGRAGERGATPPSGRVVRAGDGSPVGGAEVLVFRVEDQPSPRCPICRRSVRWCTDVDSVRTELRSLREGAPERTPLARTITGADGTFSLPPLPEGTEVVARATEGLAVGGEDPRADLVLEVLPPPRLRVVDEQGAPLPNLELVLFSDLDGRHRTVMSDEAGRVALAPTDRGAWVATEAPGFVPTALLMLDEGREVLTLSRPRTLSIKTVLNDRPIDADVWLVQRGHERKRSTSGGELRIDGLSHEPVELRASTRDLNSAPASVSPTQPVTQVVLSLESNAVLALTVEGDRARTRLMAVLRSRDLKESVAHAVRAGATTIFGPVQVGTYELEVSEPGAALVHRNLELHPGRTEFTLSLTGALEVRGVVVDDLGHPREDVQVSFAAEPGWAVFTNAAGEFALGLEKPGRVTLEATSSMRGQATGEFEAPTTRARLMIPREAQLVLEVRTPDRKPVQGTVELLQQQHLRGLLSFADQLESKPLTLAAGHYRLEARFDGRPPQQLEFDLAPAEERRLVLDLGAGAQVSGRVLTRAGNPVPHATLLAMCGETSGADGHADAEGRFTLGGLPAGPCTLMVSPQHRAELQDFEVQAPSRDLVLTLDASGRTVKGRVVDEQGQPLEGLRCDRKSVPTVEGRFTLFTEADALTFQVDKYAPTTVAVTRDDLGDVTLRPLASCTGVVVSPAGTPVAGAEVSLGYPEAGRAIHLSDSEKGTGAFQVELRTDRPARVNASHQHRSASALCTPGAKLRLMLADEARVDGVYFEAPGRGASTRVSARSAWATDARQSLADASGRFSLSLAEGLWLISAGVVTRTWAVQPPAMTLRLGAAADTCTLSVRADAPFSLFWLLPPTATSPDDFALAPGAARVQLPEPVRATTVAGLPCGALQLMTGMTRQPVVLAPPLTENELVGL